MITSKHNSFKVLLLLSCIMLLQACSSGARMNAMTVNTTADTIITEKNEFYQAMEIAGVTGGQKTNPLWTSEVGNEEFEQALLNSLKAHAMISVGEAKYKLVATLEEVKQPFIGFDMTVKSKVRYELTSVENQNVVYNEVVDNEYTAEFGDSFLASKRLQLANEGAIRENILNFIEKIIEVSKSTSVSSSLE